MMLAHYGAGQGIRIARKHLGWYMERFAATAPAGAPPGDPHRDRSGLAMRLLRSAFDFGAAGRGGMNMAVSISLRRCGRGGAERHSSSGRHAGADGRIAGANQAAEAFFQNSAPCSPATTSSTSCRSEARSSA